MISTVRLAQLLLPRLALFVLTLLAASLAHPVTGAMAEPPLKGVFAGNFSLSDPPVPASTVPLPLLSGETSSISDYQGRVVLVNFWATWCAPCVREMPSLDRLQAELADEGLTVLAVSFDRKGAEAVQPFVEELNLKNLQFVLDPKGQVVRQFLVGGLPTTYLIDREGKMVGGIEGPVEWDGPEALELIRYYLAPQS